MKISFVVLAWAAACTASPIGSIIEARSPGGNTPGFVQFFYDDKCTFQGGTLSIPTNNNNKVHGGPYGTRSAWFASPGDLGSWAIQDSNTNKPKNIAQNPDIVQCVAYPDGIYVTGSNEVIINTKARKGHK